MQFLIPITGWIFHRYGVPLDISSTFILTTWRQQLLVALIPGAATIAVILYILPESPHFLGSTGRIQKALIALENIHTMNSKGKTELLLSDLEVTNSKGKRVTSL